MYRLKRFAFLVVVLHRQDIRLDQDDLPAFAVDTVLQVFSQCGFTRAAFADHRHKTAVAGRLKHCLAHIAHIRRHIHIVCRLDFVVKRVAE